LGRYLLEGGHWVEEVLVGVSLEIGKEEEEEEEEEVEKGNRRKKKAGRRRRESEQREEVVGLFSLYTPGYRRRTTMHVRRW
jgi:hypothetical protein